MDKVLTPQERAYGKKHQDAAISFATRFAAKEAAIKALGSPTGLKWSDLEVAPAVGGPPRLNLKGVGAQTAERLGVCRSSLTITHDGGVAAAVVILEANEPMRPV